MDSRSSIFYLGFSLGTWLRTRVRVSLLFPLLVIVCVQRLEMQVGLIVAGVLFVSVLVHEFAHILAARATGGEGDEILIWPLGGLAFARPGNSIGSELLTAAAGPFSNLVLCAAAMMTLAIMGAPFRTDVFHLLELPDAGGLAGLLPVVLLMTAAINFKLLCLNLLPAVPLDGGQMALSIAKSWFEPPVARMRTLQLGQVVSLLLALAGVLLHDSFPVFLAFFLMVYNLHDYFLALFSDQFEDSQFGQESSLGYAAMARSERESQPGLITRWKQKRLEQRLHREQQERAENERRLDELLDKVHREGMHSLSDSEKRFLSQTSEKYRSHEH